MESGMPPQPFIPYQNNFLPCLQNKSIRAGSIDYFGSALIAYSELLNIRVFGEIPRLGKGFPFVTGQHVHRNGRVIIQPNRVFFHILYCLVEQALVF